MKAAHTREIPSPQGEVALQAARMFFRGGVLSAFESLHEALGDVFQLPLPGFRGMVLVGPAAVRFVLSEARDDLLWRAEHDPVTTLLRRGLLVVDGAEHDELRQDIAPALHRQLFAGYARAVVKSADLISDMWQDGTHVPLSAEMRRIALLSLMGAIYDEDALAYLTDLWPAIERAIRYISPGPWLIWPAVPRLGYRRAITRLDAYFLDLIARRRTELAAHRKPEAHDLVSILIASGLNDDLIRDQLLTMFIAGHDTSTALLAWTTVLLIQHPQVMTQVVAEVDDVIGTDEPTSAHLGKLTYLDRALREALRLYPPIHLGSRIAAKDLSFGGFPIPSGTRVLYSIYLTHRDRRYWPDPERFDPDRFSPERGGERPAFAYIPFGGGARNCIGGAFAQVEAKLILARLLQRFAFASVHGKLRPRMRATLELRPGVHVAVQRRNSVVATDHYSNVRKFRQADFPLPRSGGGVGGGDLPAQPL